MSRFFPTFGRMLRFLRWPLWGLVVLLVLGTIAWTIANATGASRLEETRARLRAEGYPIAITQVVPAKIGVEENAAPFYHAAFDLMVEPNESLAVFDKAQSEGFRSLDEKEKAALRTWLEKNADCFEFLHRGGSRARCVYDRDYTQGYNTLLPEIAKGIRAVKYLAVRAESQMEAGKPDAARDSLRDALAVAESFRADPVLVCQLVRIACTGIVLSRVDRFVTGDTTAEELTAWLEMVPAADRYEAMLEVAFKGELCNATEMFDRSIDEVWSLGQGSRFSGRGVLPSALSYLAGPILKRDAANFIDLMRRAIDLSRKPYAQVREEGEALMKEVEGASRMFHPITLLLFPSVHRAHMSQADLQAKLTVLRSGLECEISFKKDGRYPEKIAATDPFTGRPLDYNPAKGEIHAHHPDETRSPASRVAWTLRHR